MQYDRLNIDELWLILAKKYDMDKAAFHESLKRGDEADAKFAALNPGSSPEDERRVRHTMEHLAEEGNLEKVGDANNYRLTDKGQLIQAISSKLGLA